MAAPARSASERFDLKFVYPFMQATIDVLRLQYSFIARPGKPAMKVSNNDYPIEVVTFAGLKGSSVSGTLVACFTEKVFLQIMECMHDEKYSDTDDETIAQLVQGSNEMIGMIVWQARIALSERGIDFEPSVIMTSRAIHGGQIELSYRSTSPTVLLPFTTNVGPFQMEITVERQDNSDAEEEDIDE